MEGIGRTHQREGRRMSFIPSQQGVLVRIHYHRQLAEFHAPDRATGLKQAVELLQSI